MKGLKPYLCIHFTRTHWLSIAVFQTCRYWIWAGRMLQSPFPVGRARTTTCVQPKDPNIEVAASPPRLHLFLLTLSSTEDLLDFVWGLLLINKNYLLGVKPLCLVSLRRPLSYHAFLKWSTLEYKKWIPEDPNPPAPKAKQNSSTSGIPTGRDWGPRPTARWRPVLLPFSPSDASGLESKPSTHRPRGAFPTSGFIPTVPVCFPFLSKQAHLYLSEGKMREAGGSWLKNSNFPLIKVFYENEYFLRFEFSKNKKMIKWSCRPNQSLFLTHREKTKQNPNPACARNSKMTKNYKINQ